MIFRSGECKSLNEDLALSAQVEDLKKKKEHNCNAKMNWKKAKLPQCHQDILELQVQTGAPNMQYRAFTMQKSGNCLNPRKMGMGE